MMVYGLVVAGGKGARLKGPLPKQYLELAGLPILTRTLQVFHACETVTGIVIVVPREDIDYCRETIVSARGLQRKLTAIVAGGPSRQESVRKGLEAIGGDDSIVAIHDAVRPLLASSDLTACVAAARRHGAAILGVPVWDTLKAAHSDGSINRTIPRENVWLAQTPQSFHTVLIRKAHAKALRQGYQGTDDAELVERLGKKVHVVPGSRLNIKITTAEDLAMAEALLRRADAGVQS
jgi:2-C-methyl-D-erythritol 4-phosphate cytidylyltransferase